MWLLASFGFNMHAPSDREIQGGTCFSVCAYTGSLSRGEVNELHESYPHIKYQL